MSEFSKNRILSNLEHVGTPNNVALKLVEKSADPDFSIEDLCSLVSHDQTVCSVVLKAANTVHFARGQRIKTVQHAVAQLGIANVKSLLFAIEVFGIFKGEGENELFNEKDFWKYSIAGAHVASKYASFNKFKDPETHYVSALFQNIGILALRQYAPIEFNSILLIVNSKDVSFQHASRAILGFSHRHLSHLIGLRWNLPSIIVEAINDPDYFQASSEEVREVQKSIAFADDLLHVTNFCVWDKYYSPGNVELSGIPCEEMFKDTEEVVEGIFQELWN